MPVNFQLEFDFRVPVDDPVTVPVAARSLGISKEAVRELILCGKLQALDIKDEFSYRSEYRIPLKNFIAFLNNEFPETLYFKFPDHVDVLEVPDIARRLKCSDQHIYNQIRSGKFPNAMNIGSDDARTWRIPLRDFVGYVNSCREGV